jgi:hypothetical protein
MLREIPQNLNKDKALVINQLHCQIILNKLNKLYKVKNKKIKRIS